VIHVVTAVITAPGDYKMTTSTAKQTETAQAVGEIAVPKAVKKARVPARDAHVAPAKGKQGKKVTPPKKAAKAPKTAKADAQFRIYPFRQPAQGRQVTAAPDFQQLRDFSRGFAGGQSHSSPWKKYPKPCPLLPSAFRLYRRQ